MAMILAAAHGLIALIVTIIGFVFWSWAPACLGIGAFYLVWAVVGILIIKETEKGDAISTPGLILVLQTVWLVLTGLVMLAVGALWGAA